VKYAVIVGAYEKIEGTTKRLEMTDFLVDLLKNTSKEIIDKVVYLTQGKIHPDFVGLEIGVAEKLAIKALARASGIKESKIKEDLKKTGDIGKTAQNLIGDKKQVTFFQQPLTVQGVYEVLDKMAKTSGSGAIDLKISLLAGLLASATPIEARYTMRTVTGNLRLGIADMTVLDALAIAYGGGKESRELIERAYNISSDLGRVRLSSPEEILEKLGGKCIAEYKYDGERIQIHKKVKEVTLFSRRLENISNQYPDAIKLIKTCVKTKGAILEAECVAIDPDTGEMKPFQELMHRRRKYGIKEAMKEYPVSLFMFDTLYVDCEDLTLKPYPIRRRELEEAIEESDRVKIAKYIVTSNVKELENFFLEAIEDGCEGLVCKSVAEDSVYQAGARGWLWIKYKRDYKSEMTDTVDLVLVGAFHGRGKRAGTYGALLLAAYNPDNDAFETVTKCGTGFTDEDLAKLPRIMKKHVIPHRHPRVQSMVEAEVWFDPAVVIEVLGAEITLSPIHTCAMNNVRKGSGLAIRFPRFTGNYRLDKSAEDATTVTEIVEMYRNQLKRISES